MAEKGCAVCDHYSALVEPRERSDGAVIYGYCFKSGDKDYSPNMGKGFPVFVDGAGAACKTFKRRKKKLGAISALCAQQQPNDWICTLKCIALMEEGMCSHGGLCCLHESQRTIEENAPLTLDELLQMNGEPVWIVEYPDWGHWELSADAGDYVAERDYDCYGMKHDDPAGRYGLHKLGWLAFRQKPEEKEHGV